MDTLQILGKSETNNQPLTRKILLTPGGETENVSLPGVVAQLGLELKHNLRPRCYLQRGKVRGSKPQDQRCAWGRTSHLGARSHPRADCLLRGTWGLPPWWPSAPRPSSLLCSCLTADSRTVPEKNTRTNPKPCSGVKTSDLPCS